MQKPPLVHMAIDSERTVIAHFARWSDAMEFCNAKGFLNLPFNPANYNREPVPAVGSTYSPYEVAA